MAAQRRADALFQQWLSFRAKCNTFARRRLHARLGSQRSPAPATLKASSSRVEIILHSVNLQSALRAISVEIPAEKCPVIRFQITKTSWRSWNTFSS
ncbi:hypothetical protein CEXT_708821 [Caerostris extrusa]|uniref:Uncharacterized protein n=1 Tax=Caerostris extrusa TaxID=172846 RepID=A0AAV4N8R4_CAEEX|nr:hypothetical protein CEXT_708821 [Caerostris extrusa]